MNLRNAQGEGAMETEEPAQIKPVGSEPTEAVDRRHGPTVRTSLTRRLLVLVVTVIATTAPATAQHQGSRAQGANTFRLTACLTGVPPAHWSDAFSIGIEFSAPVEELKLETFTTESATIIGSWPDNGSNTRWRVRIRPGWSADAGITLQRTIACVNVADVCSSAGAPLSHPVRLRVPARPTGIATRTPTCERNSAKEGPPSSIR